MKGFVILRDVDNRAVRKDPVHRSLEGGPFERAVKIIDHQEPAAQQVIANSRRFLVVEVPVADLDRIDPREIVDIAVQRNQDAALVGRVHRGQPVDSLEEMMLGLGPVSAPRLAAIARLGIAVARIGQPDKLEFARLLALVDRDSPEVTLGKGEPGRAGNGNAPSDEQFSGEIGHLWPALRVHE